MSRRKQEEGSKKYEVGNAVKVAEEDDEDGQLRRRFQKQEGSVHEKLSARCDCCSCSFPPCSS